MIISTLAVASDSSKAEKMLNEVFLTMSQPFIWMINSSEEYLTDTWDNILNYNENLDQLEKYKALAEQKERELEQEKIRFIEFVKKLEQTEYQRSIEEMNQDLFKDSPWSTVVAEIIVRDYSSFYNSFIINKGEMHGIKENMPVIAFQVVKKEGLEDEPLKYVAVGKISKVTRLASKIMPITDPDCIVHARLFGQKHGGFLEGRGNYEKGLFLTQVDKMARIEPGDEVISSGGITTHREGSKYSWYSIFPKGIAIGRVVKDVTIREANFMKKVLVEPYVDFTRLDRVFVIKTEFSEDLKLLLDEKK